MNATRKKQLRNGVLLSVLAGTMLLSSAAWAEGKNVVDYNSSTYKDAIDKDKNKDYRLYPQDSSSNNDLTLRGVKPKEDGETLYGVAGGFAQDKQDIKNNTVTITEGTDIEAEVAGGYSKNTTEEVVVAGNEAVIEGGSQVTNNVYGGYSRGTGAVGGVEEGARNKATVTGSGTGVTGNVYGGYNYKDGGAKVVGNEAHVEEGGKVTGNVYGGYSNGTGDVGGVSAGNSVTVTGSGSEVTDNVYGGYIEKSDSSGKVAGNEAIIDDGSSVTGNVYGGYTAGTGDVGGVEEGAGNKVTISGENTGVAGNIYGGYVHGGDGNASKVAGNEVEITGGQINRTDSEIYGGYTNGDGAVTQNKVTVTGNAKVGSDDKGKDLIYGGSTKGSGAVTGNRVTITGGGDGEEFNVKAKIAGGKGGSATAGAVSGNTVEIKDGAKVKADTIYGGDSDGETISENKVTISGSTVEGYNDGTNDGASRIVGGHAKQGTKSEVTGNEVEITDSTLHNTRVFGGYSYTDLQGKVSGNTVTISNSQVKNDKKENGDIARVAGGYIHNGAEADVDSSGEVADNTVTVKDKSTIEGVVYGGSTRGNGNISNNQVFIEDSTVTSEVAGGYGENKNANTDGIKSNVAGNSVHVYVGSTVDAVYGGHTLGEGNITGNTVIVGDDEGTKNTVKTHVAGGYGENEDTQNRNTTIKENTVEVKAGSVVEGSVYGGVTKGQGFISDNTVNIYGTVGNDITDDQIVGGYIDNQGTTNASSVNGNVVNVYEGAEVNASIIGGYTKGKGDVGTEKGNEVHVTGSTITMNVEKFISQNGYNAGIMGGLATNSAEGSYGNIENNLVDIKDSTIWIDYSTEDYDKGKTGIFGGKTRGNGSAKNNKVSISGSKVHSPVFGGLVVFGSEDERTERSGEASENHVEITDSEIDGNVYGGYVRGPGDVKDNTVLVQGDTTVSGNVYGTYSMQNQGEFTGNKVTIAGGTVKGNVGGARVDRQESEDGSFSNASENIVTVGKDATVEGSVFGGQNRVGHVNGNKVTIAGTVTGDLIAGAISTHKKGETGEGNMEAEKNTVTLLQGANVESCGVYGVYFTDNHVHENLEHNGNAIYFGRNEEGAAKAGVDGENVWRGTVKRLGNFDEMHYADFNWKTGDSLVTVTEGENSNLSLLTDVYIPKVNFKPGTRVEAGDRMTLLDIGTLIEDGVDYGKGEGGLKFHLEGEEAEKKFFTFEKGVSTEVTVEAKVKDGDMIMEVNGITSQAQNEPIAETRAMAMAFVNISEDLIHEVLNDLGRDHLEGIKTFAFGYGTDSTYDLGDGLKLNGWSFLTGIDNARHIGKDDEELNFTLFFETGTGNFRLFNTFYDKDKGVAIHFRGDGGMIYNGGGIAARFQKKNGVYYEGSVRGGVLKNNIGNGFMDKDFNTYGYESENKYFGCHAGIGRIVSTGEHSVFNMYAKYFHTYTEKDSWTLFNGEGGTVGDYYDLDGIKSDRVRVGGRVLTHKGHPNQYYYGLAYEYEFSGDIHMKASGAPVDADSLKGGTGILELGFNYKKDPDSPWSFDLNTKGYVGAREGVSAQLQATYTF